MKKSNCITTGISVVLLLCIAAGSIATRARSRNAQVEGKDVTFLFSFESSDRSKTDQVKARKLQ